MTHTFSGASIIILESEVEVDEVASSEETGRDWCGCESWVGGGRDLCEYKGEDWASNRDSCEDWCGVDIF